MAEQILMLALSPTMEKGTITKWLKKVGDKVASGEVICEVETDKAAMDYESMADGVLLKIVVPEGGQASIGECIAVIGQEGDGVSDSQADKQVQAEPAKPVQEPVRQPVSQPKIEASTSSQIKSTPLARKMASQHGIEIGSITGTGPAGRVILRDIEQAMASGNKPAKSAGASKTDVSAGILKDEEIPVSGIRKVIAQRLVESKFSAPHYYLKVSADASELVRTRQKLKLDSAKNVSINAFLLKLTAEMIKHHPAINSTWAGDKIIRHGRIDIALAVALDDGLITPVVRDCGNKGIMAIETELAELIALAKAGKLQKEQYNNSTFTISNLGSFGIDDFTAIINPPGSAILAVGQISKRPVVDAGGNIVAASMMNMTLSCDHRVIDGAVGAAFMSDLKHLIEEPMSAFY
jgi:pyruvate dehydrogenase E2 component (dihydrolipoamide acetyltransferase)